MISLTPLSNSSKMKLFILATISLLILCFEVHYHAPYSTLTLSLLPLSFFSLLLPFFLNLSTIGGFAWRNHNQNPNKIPGPTGWPFLGILPNMDFHAHRKLASMASSMGASRLMAFSLGATRLVISSHPETAKEILCGSSFSDRPMKDSARLLMFNRAIGFAPSGKYWRQLRRIAVTSMFSPRRISSLEGLRQRVGDGMVEKVWEEMCGRGVVEVRGILHECSLRNVIESVFGSGLGLEGEELGFLVKEGYELIGESNWGDYFPLLVFDFYGMKRRCHKLASKVKVLVGQIVEDRKRDGGFSGKNDFLSVLLYLPEKDQLCHADMVAVLWEMIFRGTDTVAILLEWIMARMVMHQDVQEKVRNEINKCVGNHGIVNDSDIPNLPYLQAVVKEVLRLHPPGPLLSWARLATHDVHVGKFFVPAGTTAMVNMWAITHDSSIWADPCTFRPERFIEEEVSIMGSDLRLAPFGSGRRVCPGKSLGLATVHLWLARLLHEFKWVSTKPVDLSECLKLSLEMKKPLTCQVVRGFPALSDYVPNHQPPAP